MAILGLCGLRDASASKKSCAPDINVTRGHKQSNAAEPELLSRLPGKKGTWELEIIFDIIMLFVGAKYYRTRVCS